jgi:hypothetical protein
VYGDDSQNDSRNSVFPRPPLLQRGALSGDVGAKGSQLPGILVTVALPAFVTQIWVPSNATPPGLLPTV